MKSIDEIGFHHVPVNRIESATAWSKLALGIDADAKIFSNNRHYKVHTRRSKSSRHDNAEIRKGTFDSFDERHQSFCVHAESSSHALVEQNVLCDTFVIPKPFHDFLRIVVGLLDSVLADLENNLQ